MTIPHPDPSVDAAAPARLRVLTRPIPEPVELLDHLPAELTAAFLHRGQGIVGIGCAHRIRVAGPERFAAASAQVMALGRAAEVRDEAGMPGSGLVALGSFSYADASPRSSELIVPRAILGVGQDGAFWTVVERLGESQTSDLAGRDWRELFGTTPAGAPLELEIEPAHTPDEYQGLVARAVERIRDGEAAKVVLSETSQVMADADVVLPALLARLAATYPSTWVFRMGDVIGASPEMLARVDHGRIRSRVLAGTRPVAEGGELTDEERAAFQTDAKERDEHAYAVDSVSSAMASVGRQVEVSSEPFVLRLPGIEHLASDVTALVADGATSLDVAGALHPSAAVSGTPRREADAIIGELERRDRGGYAAPVGWMDANGDGQWAIALRMAHVVSERELTLQAGGGLVAASDPVTEHAEVLAKTRPVLSALRSMGR